MLLKVGVGLWRGGMWNHSFTEEEALFKEGNALGWTKSPL